MLPKYHILISMLFSFSVWLIFPNIGFYTFAIFFSSVFIDVDHYLVYVKRKKDFNLKRAANYFLEFHKQLKKSIRKRKKVKAPLVVFHTIEFLLLVAVFSLFSKLVFFILIGFLFHSLLDIIDIYLEFGTLSVRYFSLISYLINKDKTDIKQL